MSDSRSKVLIAAAELAALLDARTPVVLLDIRDEPGAPSAAAQERPRIPGAVAAYLATEFSGPPTALGGRRPLPDIAALQAHARRWGIDPGSAVVVYDDNSGAQAARAWWTLRWAGVDNVRLLDGGLAAWREGGRPTTTVVPEPRAGSVVLSAGHLPTIEADHAATLAARAVLLDARGRAAYLGAPAQPGKPPSGHIPGAISAPSGDNIAADGCFRSTADLRAHFATLGVFGHRPIGVYCGSGNAAAHEIAALSAIGIEAALYVGSWSAWSADPARPVAVGDDAAAQLEPSAGTS
jgi:thiosulfate/3-mercaptopyruvate sulfurtransferase